MFDKLLSKKSQDDRVHQLCEDMLPFVHLMMTDYDNAHKHGATNGLSRESIVMMFFTILFIDLVCEQKIKTNALEVYRNILQTVEVYLYGNYNQEGE